MVFVDGENLSKRYGAMVSGGKTPRADVIAPSADFVWSGRIIGTLRLWYPLRVNYYTSLLGDDPGQKKLKEEIQKQPCPVEPGDSPHFLVPHVFRKEGKSKEKEVNVDLNIAIDCLRHVYQNHVDRVVLITGDGDYEPLIKEVFHQGKIIIVAALSSGLSERIKRWVDAFHSLDEVFFE